MSSDTPPKAPSPPALMGNHSKVIRHRGDHTWEGLAPEAYKADAESWRGVTRWELCGTRGESPRFHVRYFEIAPGGHTTFERHEHEHVVIPQRGRGEVRFGGSVYRVGPGDVIYVGPDDPHQFSTPDDAEEPFGFLCMVNAERDRPRAADGPGVCHICE